MGRDQPGDTADRVANGTCEPSSAFLARPLSRRRLLQGAGALATAVVLAEACSPNTVIPRPSASPGGQLLRSAPVPSPSRTPGPVLTASLLLTAVGDLATTGTLALPGGGSATVADLSAAGVAFAVAGPQVPRLDRNPLAALGLALAAADWSGQTGAVDLAGALPKLPLTPVRLVLPQLPGGQTTDTLGAAVPAGLTLRPGTALLLAGVLADGRIVAGMADPARTVANHPRLELAVLTTATLAPLLALAGASLDPSGASLTLSGGTHVLLTPIEPALAARLVAGAGVLFVDRVPLQPKGAKPALTLDPIVPAPPTSVATQIRSIGQVSDGRVLGSDASGTAVARARYRPWRSDWEWVTDPDEVDGYTIRELADALGITFASFAVAAPLGDPDLVRTWEMVANTLLIGNELDMADPNWVFGPWTRDDWAAMLARWSDVSAAFASRRVPDGFNLVWLGAEEQLSFARSEGVRYVQAGNLLWGSNGVLPAVYSGGFSNVELRKIIEFMVKVRVLKYAGQVQEWIAVSEASADLLWGGAKQRFWYDRLGTEIIDQVFTWAHEADPKTRLAFCEDRVLDRDTEVTRATGDRFMEFLRHFKAAGVPVDKAVLENNLWIYAPPSKDTMVATLREITRLGYAIGAAETTVSISDHDPVWTDRPRSVKTVTDRLQAQAYVYRDLLDAYLEVGAEFGVWSAADPYSWLNTWGTGHADTKALLLDDNFQPKPAYFAVRDVLKKRAGLA